MKRLDDRFDKTSNQGDQHEGKILEQDRGVGKQTRGAIFPLKGGWTSTRRPASSFKFDLSTIATSARLIIFVGLVAILYFGRPVFVPLAVAILLTFILAPFVRVLRRWRFGRISSTLTVVLIAFLAIFGLGMELGAQVTHLAGALPKYQQTLTKKIDALRGATAGSGTLGQASAVLRELDQGLENAEPRSKPSGVTQPRLSPVPVEIHQPDPEPLEVIQRIISPLLESTDDDGGRH